MPSLIFDTDFESPATLSSLFGGAASSNAALESTVVNRGSQGMSCSGNPCYQQHTFTANAIYVGRVYFYLNSIPSQSIELFSVYPASGNAIRFGIQTGATPHWGVQFGTTQTFTTLSGMTAIAGAWHRLDIRVNVSGTTWTVDWQIDGVAQTQATSTGQVAQTIGGTGVYFGHPSGFSVAVTVFFDTYSVSQTSADYPLGVPPKVAAASDTGLTVSDALTYTMVRSRPMTDSGISLSDSVARVYTPASKTYNISPSDTGLTISDGIAMQMAWQRAVSDTGLAVADALTRAQVMRMLAEAGISIADSVRLWQPAWPISDISDGGWTVVPLWSNVDEQLVPNDSDQITSGAGSSDTAELKLSSMKRPITLSGGTKLRYRVKRQASAVLTVYLMQGSTVIASWSHPSLPTSFTTYEQVLTDPQVATITDYTNLSVRFVAN